MRCTTQSATSSFEPMAQIAKQAGLPAKAYHCIRKLGELMSIA